MALRWLVTIGVLVASAAPIRAQDDTPAALPRPTVTINEADSATLAHLERFQALLAEHQWQEAIETIRHVAETRGEQLVLVTPGDSTSLRRFPRFVPLSTFCQMKLVELARRHSEALALYREQVDPVASRLLAAARNQRDQAALVALVRKYFASSYADQTLMLLGEMALERGDWTEARRYWEQISPLLRFPAHDDPRFSEFAGQPLWLITRHLETVEDWEQTIPLLQTCDGEPNWLAYRDADLNVPDVRACLALVSILEGDAARARTEIELIDRLFPDTRGEIGGREGTYVELLRDLLNQSQAWPPLPQQRSWPTFAGNDQRQRVIAFPFDFRSLENPGDLAGTSPSWQLALPTFSGDGELIGSEGSRVAESLTELLSYHPIVVGDAVIVQAGASESDILACRIGNGQLLFGNEEIPAVTIAPPGLKRSVGVPRFPLSSYGSTVYARVGSLPTGTNVDIRQDREEPARIVGLDLESEGRLVVQLRLDAAPWDSNWAFDGVPISDGESLYIAMRHRSSVHTENHVACFDARTARLHWRRMIVGAEPAGSQRPFELTHTLLTLRDETIYCNTNLGVVAALEKRDGAIRWLTQYPRVDFQNDHPDRDTQHLFRDLTPCLVYRDLVIVAPMDCDQLFALDANTGILIWASIPGQATDAIHLLGVGEEHLIASGDYLYWFDVSTGRLVSQFPPPHRSLPGHAKPSPRGYGRGILVEKHVYWPTRESIFVFDQRIRREMNGITPDIVSKIDLVSRGVTGGNLVFADDTLLIAAQDRLIAFDRDGKQLNSGPPRANIGDR